MRACVRARMCVCVRVCVYARASDFFSHIFVLRQCYKIYIELRGASSLTNIFACLTLQKHVPKQSKKKLRFDHETVRKMSDPQKWIAWLIACALHQDENHSSALHHLTTHKTEKQHEKASLHLNQTSHSCFNLRPNRLLWSVVCNGTG